MYFTLYLWIWIYRTFIWIKEEEDGDQMDVNQRFLFKVAWKKIIAKKLSLDARARDDSTLMMLMIISYMCSSFTLVYCSCSPGSTALSHRLTGCSRWLRCSTRPSPGSQAHSWSPPEPQTQGCHASPSEVYPPLAEQWAEETQRSVLVLSSQSTHCTVCGLNVLTIQ